MIVRSCKYSALNQRKEILQQAVIPAKAGLSTAKLVIHLDLAAFHEKKMVSRLTSSAVESRGNDVTLELSAAS